MRLTAVWLIPIRRASRRVLQCVPCGGACSSVVASTWSTRSSVIVRGAPGRGSSVSPASPRCAYRPRHFATVCRLVWSRSAISKFVSSPDAAASTMRARRASAWAVFGRRAQLCKVSRSASLTVIGMACGAGMAPSRVQEPTPRRISRATLATFYQLGPLETVWKRQAAGVA